MRNKLVEEHSCQRPVVFALFGGAKSMSCACTKICGINTDATNAHQCPDRERREFADSPSLVVTRSKLFDTLYVTKDGVS